MNATLVLVATAGLVVAADVSTKAAARCLPAAGIGHRSFGLRLVLNRRPGLAGLSTAAATAILAGLAVAAAVVAATATPEDATTPWALGLALGGAVGNVADRVFRGAVVDFVIIGRWPAFNMADVALVGGAVAAIVAAVA